MKTASLILFLLFATIAKAEFPPRIAASERVVTLEQWGGRGNDALVWAVRPTEIVIYHVFSSTPDELLATVPIESRLRDAIRAAVAKIKEPMRGKVWFDPEVFDGSMLRISFSPDGDLRHDRIEVANYWRPDFGELVELVSSACPEKWKIRFGERVAHLEEGGRKANIRCVSVKEYYREK
jgi:hypothetical protein